MSFKALSGKESIVASAATILASKPAHKFAEVLTESITITSFSQKNTTKVSSLGEGLHLVRYEDKVGKPPYWRLFSVNNGVTTAYNLLSRYKETIDKYVSAVPGTSQMKVDVVLCSFVNLSTRIQFNGAKGAEWYSLEEWQILPNSNNLVPDQVIEAGTISQFVIPTSDVTIVMEETKNLIVELPTVAQYTSVPSNPTNVFAPPATGSANPFTAPAAPATTNLFGNLFGNK